jgi:hypothetical protein
MHPQKTPGRQEKQSYSVHDPMVKATAVYFMNTVSKQIPALLSTLSEHLKNRISMTQNLATVNN